MKQKNMWLILGCLVVLTLAVTSCGPAAVEEEGKTVVGKVVEKEEAVVGEEKEVVAPAPKGPRYGGILTISLSQPLLGFDDATTVPWHTLTVHLTNDELLIGDWAKGPAGTGEASWKYSMFNLPLMTGRLAESWEMADPQTIVFHLRKGVRFHDKPPVNGRELVADDIVYTWDRLLSYEGYYYAMQWGKPEERPEVTAPDKYTIVLKAPSPGKAAILLENFGDKTHIIPREMVEKWGDMRDWRAACGSGPFMLVDHVPASSSTLVRNPTYWMKDPVNPENTLPYLDGVEMLVIQDYSTRLAALRTGKIDHMSGVNWEDVDGLKNTHPDLTMTTQFGTAWLISMRCDTEPFDDIRVRQAMQMAVDQEAIKEYFLGGNGEILTCHVLPLPAFSDIFTPLEELPESTRELFEYHPEKAKQLLAEAGYPDGFKTNVVCFQSLADVLSIVKDNLAQIGVDMELNVKEFGVWKAIMITKAFDQMYVQYANPAQPWRLSELRWGSTMNTHMVEDPMVEEAYVRNYEEYFNPDERWRILKEANAHALSQAWHIHLPTAYAYIMWWPWLKSYHGELSVGFQNAAGWPMFVWIDQELKKEMIGK